MSDLFSATYNPDVLSCLANLSNDEVFTPPEVVNQMLDMLPQEIWSDKNATFLDPACKSGVFLREIAKRLIEAQLPNYEQISYEINEKLRAGGELDGRDIAFQNMLEDVIEHVFKNQVFGIAITELTSLLSRRSVYCSKYPQSEYSVVRFDNPEGRIDYKQMLHTWKNGKCFYCGASEGEYNREEGKEQYAYEFIHLDNPEEVFDMKFDVIIGNPPYQMSDGGNNASAMPIYQKFVEQAKKLNPRFLIMITPSRWFSGGRGLDKYRAEMLSDRRIARLVDFEDASECFPGVDMSGGVSYFLWSRDYQGECEVINVKGDERISANRYLDAHETLIRSNRAVSIVDKVCKKASRFMEDSVSSQRPFGLRTFAKPTEKGDLILRWREGRGPISSSDVTAGHEWISKYKVIVSRVVYEHAGGTDAKGQRRVLSVLDILEPNEVCTETYIVVDVFQSEEAARNCLEYLKKKLPRYLISQVANAQMVTKKSFSLVPSVDFNKSWSDEELYELFGLDTDEIEVIEKAIKPMDSGD